MVLAVRVGHGFRVPCSFRDPNPAGCGPECSGSGPIPASGPGVSGLAGSRVSKDEKAILLWHNYSYDQLQLRLQKHGHLARPCLQHPSCVIRAANV